MLCDCKCLTGYCTGEIEFGAFPQKTGTKIFPINPKLFVPVNHTHAIVFLVCNNLCVINRLRTEADRDVCCLPIKSGEKIQCEIKHVSVGILIF